MRTTCGSSFPLHRAFANILVLFSTAALLSSAALGDEIDYSGDVTDVRTIRRVEQHPQAWRVWQPFIIQGDKKNQLLVAFGAMRNGKKDMGDIFATLPETTAIPGRSPSQFLITRNDRARFSSPMPTRCCIACRDKL